MKTNFKCIDCGCTVCTAPEESNDILKVRIQKVPETGRDAVCCACNNGAKAKSLGMTREEYGKYLIDNFLDSDGDKLEEHY